MRHPARNTGKVTNRASEYSDRIWEVNKITGVWAASGRGGKLRPLSSIHFATRAPR